MANTFQGFGDFGAQFGFPPQQQGPPQQQMGGFPQPQIPQQNQMIGFNAPQQQQNQQVQGFNQPQQKQAFAQPSGFNTQPIKDPLVGGFASQPIPQQQMNQFQQFDGFGQAQLQFGQQGQQGPQMMQGQQGQQMMQGPPGQQMMMQGPPGQQMMQGPPGQQMMQMQPGQQMQGPPNQQMMQGQQGPYKMPGQFGAPNQQQQMVQQGGDQFGGIGYQQQAPQAPPKLRVKLENSEKGVYSAMYTSVDPSESNCVKREKVVEFFLKSGLDQMTLGNIWQICVPEGETMDRDQFYVALRLIAYAQNGIEISEQSVRQNIKSPQNPKFIPKNQPPQNLGLQQPGFDNQPGNIIGQFPQQPPQQQQQQQQQLRGQQIPQSQIQQPQQGSLYSFTAEDYQKYERYYDLTDVNKSGQVTGQQARQIYSKSQLPKEVLKLIWTLSDQENKGYLTKYQFIIMVHLVSLAKQGVQVPPTLLPEYVQFIQTQGKSILSQKSIQAQQIQSSIQPQGGFINQPPIQPTLPQQAAADNQIKQFSTFTKDPLLTDSQNQQNLQGAGITLTQSIMQSSSPPNNTADKYESAPPPVLQQQISNQKGIQQPSQDIDIGRLSISAQLPLQQQQQQPQYQQQQQPQFQQQQQQQIQFQQSTNNLPPQFEISLQNEQKKMSSALEEVRGIHSSFLEQQNKNLEIFNQIIEAYTKTNKKFQDENQLLKEDIKALQDKQQLAVQQLTEIGMNFHSNLQTNKQLQQGVIQIATESITAIQNKVEVIFQLPQHQNSGFYNQQQHQDQLGSQGFQNQGFENLNFEVSYQFNNAHDQQMNNAGNVQEQQWGGEFDNQNQLENPEKSMQW